MDDIFASACKVYAPQYNITSDYDPVLQKYTVFLSENKNDHRTKLEIPLSDIMKMADISEVITHIIRIHEDAFEEIAYE